jgi:transcriptional regulator with XRE-family HTH domain
MFVGDRLRAIREAKKLSQGDVESRTGLLRCYVSRVENGHTVPSVETLEKFARALEIPLYRLFYEGEKEVERPKLLSRVASDATSWGSVGKDARTFHRLRSLLGRMTESDRRLLLYMAQKMGSRPVPEKGSGKK